VCARRSLEKEVETLVRKRGISAALSATAEPMPRRMRHIQIGSEAVEATIAGPRFAAIVSI
jgi:hypothetical protein